MPVDISTNCFDFVFFRIIFWTEFGPPAQIKRANLDGTGAVTIVVQKLLYPSGLAIDYATKR